MYEKVLTDLNFADRELKIISFWNENKIFEKSIEIRKNSPSYIFYDGPPTANGMPHIGHVLTRAIKDLIPRYKTMKGYKVLRKAGWDTHGLPVELEIEKMLQISGKPEIEKYGVEKFIQKCKESVWKYKEEWEIMSQRVAYWVDMDEPYVTYENNYIESVWWALKQIHNKNLLYKGHRVVPYCPRCGTSLSSHEVAQGYKDVKEKSMIAKFKVANAVDEYLLAWTTTPWTLPSNLALAVNAKEDYVKILNKENNEKYILAEALLTDVIGFEYEILERYKGADLENLKYDPLFDFQSDLISEKAHFVVCADFVTLTDGTGIVHIAPAFGEDDYQVGKQYKLPFLQLVDLEGNLTSETGEFAGIFVKDADPLIIDYLSKNNKVFKVMDYEHNYPFCWRCKTPLIYYARESWFIKMSEYRDQLVANNETVNWIPENVKKGRFGNFLENIIDWNISRERYWGTPLPIWECDCGYEHAIGSVAELKEMGGVFDASLELHKPFIDDVKLDCPKCKGKMNRVTEVIDCWFDAGSMPFAQWHYPFENKEMFGENFPADFISEAIDQTRGWFYVLMAISTVIFNQAPYKNVLVMGHILDKDGHKMSKHLGNTILPNDALEKVGADALRWHFYHGAAPWLPSRFSLDAVSEGQRKFMGTLWNTYAFYILYASIDKFDPTKYTLDYETLSVTDKWLLSKLNTLINDVDVNLENYKITEASRALNNFVDELSNWYVRRSRERFWASEMPQDKINAYMTLYTTLKTVVQLSAPFTPFIAENIYSNLVKSVDKTAEESVHLTSFPVADKRFIDKDLENNMDLVLDIVGAGRAARNNSGIKNRQPIGEIYVKSETKLSEQFNNVILEELNIKQLKYVDNTSEYTTYTFKPQLKTLGPKYGKILSKISKYLQEVDGNDFMSKLQKGDASFEIDGETVALSIDDVLAETGQIDGFYGEKGSNCEIVLNTTLSEKLLEEGFVREIISKVQTMRKDAGFEVMNKINLYVNTTDKLIKIINSNLEEIKSEVLANDIIIGNLQGFEKDWTINGEQSTFAVEKQNSLDL